MSRELPQLSAQPGRVLLEWLTARDLSDAEWILDLPIRSEELRAGRRQIPWELFLTLCTRLRNIAGASLPPIAIGREIGERLFSSKVWRSVADGSTPEELYLVRADEVAGAFFAGLRVESVAEETCIRLSLEVPSDCGSATAFFELTAGVFERAPRALARPPAHVSCEITGNRAVYTVSMPHAATEPLPGSDDGRQERSTEASHQRLLDAAPDILCEVTPDGTLTYVSPAIEEVLGFRAERFVGKSFIEFLLPEEVPEQLENFSKLLRASGSQRVAFRAPHADGSRRWLEASVRPFVDAEDRTRIACILRDVSEQKLGSAALHEREAHYRSLVENIADGVAICDAAGVLQRASPQLERWLEASGTRTLASLVHPDDRERWAAAWHRAATEGSAGAIDLRIVADAQQARWFDVRWTPFRDAGGELRYSLSLRDITRRRQGEDALRAIAEGLASDEPPIFPALLGHLAGALEADTAFIAVLDGPDQARTLAVWDAGEPSDDFQFAPSGTPCESAHGHDIRCYPSGVQQLFPGDDDLHRRGIDGYMGMPLVGRGTEVLGWLCCLFRDPIAEPERARVLLRLFGNRAAIELERMRELGALQESRARFTLLAEAPHELISEIGEDGHVVYVSPNLREILGYDPEHFAGRDFLPLVHPDDRARAARAFRAVVDEGRRGFATYRFRHSDGRDRWLDTSGGAYTNAAGRQVSIFLSRDVTERMQTREALRRSEEELRQAQKMEAIGRLAGGVAHDFNNLLTAIIGYGDLLLEQVSDDSSRHDAQEILNAARRAEGLTRQLLAFSRRQVLQPTVLDVNALVASLDRMLRRLIGEDIEIRTRLDGDLWPVRADASQIEQVLLNLAVNARDAMPQGGRIDIETDNERVRANATEVDLPAGDYVCIRVRDAGAGMDAGTLSRIFEPFFTTKDQEKGTGLGLSMVYGIVRQSGGQIRVESELGAGTCFSVYLPRTEHEHRAQRRRAQLAQYRGSETVLVVEDSDPVRQLVERYLERLGYEVLVAAEWDEARRFCEEFARPIHLLLTDVILPKVDGIEIARRARALRPDLRVVYMSGFSGDLVGSPEEREDDFVLLEKPFTPSTLLRTVREQLDAAPPHTSKSAS